MKRLIDFFRGTPQAPSVPPPPSAPVLRSKAGGMAWIKPYGHEYGADVLAGLAVKTVRVIDGDFWEIDPRPQYVVRGIMRSKAGDIAYPGDTVRVTAIADECLEPWRDIGDDEADESHAYLPPVPAPAKEPSHA